MKYSIKISFAKVGLMRYISHLDLLRLFGRALRRGKLPFGVSEGFSKHPKIVIKRALKLGLESENEEVVFGLREYISPDDFKARLQKQLPEGIQIQ
jgi:radical SAM-linked protein